MAIDSSIALSGQKTALADPLDMYSRAMSAKGQQIALDQHQQSLDQQRTLADLYRGAVGPDGKVDRTKIITGAATHGIGGQIPALQKGFLETDKAQGEVDEKKSVTDKNTQETLYGSLKLVDNSLASLLAHPQLNENMVAGEVGRLVNLGAFNVQAAHNKQTPDQFAQNMLSTMPVGNPNALRSWLTEAGMRVMDATKRLELTLPKYDEQNRGGTLSQGTVNQLTGQRTAGADVRLTPTAGDTLQASTTRRGQDLVDARNRETNDINREAAQSTLVESPQGQMIVNKATALARPVATATGEPVLGKDSITMKNAQMAHRLTGMIPYAKELLSGATASTAGSLVDKVNNFMGVSTKSGDKAAALEAVAGWMTSNVPRFEGPQSDKDTATYRTMAGVAGDRTLPTSTRVAALDAVQKLMGSYQVDPSTDTMVYSGPPGTRPAARVAPPPARGTGPTLAAPRGSSSAGRQPAPAAAPDINSFFR